MENPNPRYSEDS